MSKKCPPHRWIAVHPYDGGFSECKGAGCIRCMGGERKGRYCLHCGKVQPT